MRLWVCTRGYWVVVVLADSEESALDLAREAWKSEEDWESDSEWAARETGDRVAVVGWA